MLGRKRFEDKSVTVSLAELVPEDDFLKRVEREVDLSFVIPLVEARYSFTGRPSIDPTVVIKILLIGFFYGITSERRMMREIQVNLSYRYFIGYNLDEKVPDHSSLTNARARFGEKVFQEIFDEIVRQCIRAGLVGENSRLTDWLKRLNCTPGSLQSLRPDQDSCPRDRLLPW
jgi:transposase